MKGVARRVGQESDRASAASPPADSVGAVLGALIGFDRSRRAICRYSSTGLTLPWKPYSVAISRTRFIESRWNSTSR